MSSHPRKRQRYATRSCLACRKRKVKCELSNVEVASSLEPLKEEDACQRCKKMELDCIVWDGERKGKRYTIQSNSHQQSHTRSDQATTPSSISFDGEQILSPFYPFKPNFGQSSDMEPSPLTSSIDEQIQQEHEQHPLPGKTMNEKARLMGILRRPMLMMIQILERQNKFLCGIPGQRLERISSKSLNFSFLSNEIFDICDLGLIIQHPHLPRLRDLFRSYLSSPNASKKLLLYIMMFLCRVWEVDTIDQDLSKTLPIHLIKTIYQLSLQIILRLPQTIQAAQALELLAVHMPFVLYDGDEDGEKVDEQETSKRFISSKEENFTPGSTLITLAIKIMTPFIDIINSNSRSIFIEVEDEKNTKVLWASLCCWELALSFQDHCPIQTRQINISDEEINGFKSFDGDEINSWHSTGELVRRIGQKALWYRSQAILETAKCELESEKLVNEAKDSAEMKSKQTVLLDGYFESLQDQEASRCKGLNTILLGLTKGQGTNMYCTSLQALTSLTWLWLDLESNGMHQIQLTKALGNMRLFILRSEMKSSISTDGQNSQEADYKNIYRDMFRHRIWEDPEWSEHVGKYGKRRNKSILSFISSSCQLKQYFQEIQRGLKQNPSSSLICHSFIPITMLSSILINAAKSLLDVQLVLLHVWNHLHEDTNTYIVIIREVAEVWNDDELCIQILDPNTGKVEPGIGQCCADILRTIAATMFDWQEKQKLVLANHREKERRKAANNPPHRQNNVVNSTLPMKKPQDTTTSTNSSISDSITSQSNSDLINQVVQDHPSNGSSSTPFVFDYMPTVNSIFEGILDLPDWNDFMLSFEQH